MKGVLRLPSHAKVNLRLEILRRREDGYHDLRSIFQKISLCDTVQVSLGQGKGISVTSDHPGIPDGPRNLAYRAARAILNEAGRGEGIRIEIEKRIPLGAGLGGGSSNAATTLMALNELLGAGFSRKELKAIGLKIGADVPFFLMDGAALGYGIGERLRRIELPQLWFVLIYPNFEVSTRWAYEHAVLTKRQIHINLQRFVSSAEGISRILMNDLEGVVSLRYPQIREMKKVLESAGARGALMTGSGPTVFGVFPTRGEAEEGYRKVRGVVKKKGWLVLRSESLPSRTGGPDQSL
jgi:4-diphosphocytidyl-2-C-methyl-D-erythritol kinase